LNLPDPRILVPTVEVYNYFLEPSSGRKQVGLLKLLRLLEPFAVREASKY
jgi:hypothetical protein